MNGRIIFSSRKTHFLLFPFLFLYISLPGKTGGLCQAQEFFTQDRLSLDPERYQREEKPIGGGGFGAVYRLRKGGDLDKDFVVKVFHETEGMVAADGIKGELALNKFLRESGLSQIVIFPSADNTYHVKTFVNGPVLSAWLDAEEFYDEDGAAARELFATFWTKLAKARPVIYDLQAYNIMYDRDKKNWEIVDGNYREQMYPNLEISSKDYYQHARGLFNCRILKNKKREKVCLEFLAHLEISLRALAPVEIVCPGF